MSLKHLIQLLSVIILWGNNWPLTEKAPWTSGPLSHFRPIPERHRQTDRQTNRFAISIPHVSVLTCDKNHIHHQNYKMPEKQLARRTVCFIHIHQMATPVFYSFLGPVIWLLARCLMAPHETGTVAIYFGSFAMATLCSCNLTKNKEMKQTKIPRQLSPTGRVNKCGK